MKKRIVITGIGTVNPLGNSVADFWNGLVEGRSGIVKLDRFDTTDYQTKIAGQVQDFKASDYMDKKEARKMALFTQYAVAAARQAIDEADLLNAGYAPERIGTIFGNGIGGFEVTESAIETIASRGPSRVPPMTIPKLIGNEAPGNIALINGFKGPCFVVTTACASGTDALGHAVMALRSGMADAVVTGGSESSLTKLGISGFNAIQALSTGFNDDPLRASRPFDKDRDGFVIAEGAGALVLEEYEHAVKRGAPIYAELAGYGMTCDAYHLTAPSPDGSGAARAMTLAMEEAGIKPEDVDYMNAHGTSTPTNDPLETKSIKTAFGDHAYKLKISSTKSMTGHCVGGGGAIEAIACVKAMQESFIPPTVNLDAPDPECDLDYVPHKGIHQEVRCAMSNSLGFGGHNSIIVLKKVD